MENIIIPDLRDAEYAIWDFSDNNVYIYRDVNMQFGLIYTPCNSWLYCLYLFIFYTWIFVYLLISLFNLILFDRFQNIVLP